MKTVTSLLRLGGWYTMGVFVVGAWWLWVGQGTGSSEMTALTLEHQSPPNK